MIIYGTALLAVCHLLGIVLGDLLGRALGMTTNVGGVGIAMLLLIIARVWLHKQGLFNETSERGVNYWGAIYIPVVVAMAMQQDVVKALSGGWMALLAAVGAAVEAVRPIGTIFAVQPPVLVPGSLHEGPLWAPPQSVLVVMAWHAEACA